MSADRANTAAEFLVQAALEHAAIQADMSLVQLKHQPQGKRRHLHDDITVVVVDLAERRRRSALLRNAPTFALRGLEYMTTTLPRWTCSTGCRSEARPSTRCRRCGESWSRGSRTQACSKPTSSGSTCQAG